MAPAQTIGAKLAKPAIYSGQALLGFSALFNPLAGGLLAYSSLRAVGQTRAAEYALWLSIFFALFTWAVSRNLAFGTAFGVGLGYVWGNWLCQFMQRKVPGAANYPHKSIKSALWLCILLSVLVVVVNLGLRY
jgi:hypothetical protein